MRKKQMALLLSAALLVLLAACTNQPPNSIETDPGPADTQSAQPQTDDSQLSQARQVTGGTDQEHAESVPLDTSLSGKTVREEQQWFSFTTDETENATYRITLVNQTLDAGGLSLRVYDEAGETIHDPYGSPLGAGASGRASTLDLELPPDTTYYIKIWSDDGKVLNYVFLVRSPEGQQPERNIAQPGPEPTAGLEVPAATNQSDAQLLPLNAKLEGKVSRDEGQWYAFSTNSAENATYKLTLINMTRGTSNINLRVYDEYGITLHDPYGSPLYAQETGRAATLSLDLPPETTYYIYIWADEGDTIEYTLTIQAPDEPAGQ